ncbi:MAG TPA: hypothetical protein VGF59_19235 [Bryobacteraceae bacterium]|jgi:hypothetical protein
MQGPNRFRDLVWHFFGRFFDKESLSPEGDPEAGVIQTLGILAAPSGFVAILVMPLAFRSWDLVGFRYVFVGLSMIVMGFVMVIEWDALFPDRRDYQVLMPLPLRLSTLFLAKAAALGIFLAVFLFAVNFFGVLFWPGVDGGTGYLSIIGAHLTAVVAGGLFSALAIAALQGVLVTLFHGGVYRRISVAVQTALMAVLVMLLFLTPMMGLAIGGLAKANSPLLHYFPGFWFAAFYEQLRPATHDLAFRALGSKAIQALLVAAAIFLLTFLPGYRCHARRVLETPEPNPKGPGRAWRLVSGAVDRLLLYDPVEAGVFHFIGQTITRSVKHRLFLATYGGFGAALAVMTFASGGGGSLDFPLMLSFILVSGLRAAFNFPSELSANWAFQVSETHPVRPYLGGARKWIAACAIAPLFLLLAPYEFARFLWPAALFHLAFGVSTSLLLTEAMFAGFNKVPFTCGRLPGKVNMTFLAAIYVLGFTMYSRYLARLESWLVVTPWTAITFLAIAAAALAALARRRGRLAGHPAALDYQEPGDPVVRTLGLSLD